MKGRFLFLVQNCRKSVKQNRVWKNLLNLVHGTFLLNGHHTIAGMLSAVCRSHIDWSGAYRIFSESRVQVSEFFRENLKNVLSELSGKEPLCVAVDDTLLKKSGRKIPGVSYRCDPAGPKFRVNFILAQRFVQFSAILTESTGNKRGIPIGFFHTPSARKPHRKASEETLREYRRQRKIMSLPQKMTVYMKEIRKQIPMNRHLVLVGDGSYTNETVLKHIPENTTYIGRIRKDAKLYSLPEANPRGRTRIYGKMLETPEKMRQENPPEKTISIFLSGEQRFFRVRRVDSVRSKTAGEKDLSLLMVYPVGYRLKKTGCLFYKSPAYLICTDPRMSSLDILSHYISRWQIEVNFREEKSILGIHQTQVRNPNSAASVPAFFTAIYGMLLLAGHQAELDHGKIPGIPKWRKKQDIVRTSCRQYFSLFEKETSLQQKKSA
ncbi:MAG: hypothetical protein BWY42_01586 [Candidatus Omnitrophica bacterium ADurb.Bin277]|nr:MAG: hypothetical protein BWY42_01586 [Candidatus Omnitrophica bacterium ADurb.Bin277]